MSTCYGLACKTHKKIYDMGRSSESMKVLPNLLQGHKNCDYVAFEDCDGIDLLYEDFEYVPLNECDISDTNIKMSYEEWQDWYSKNRTKESF